MAADPAAILTAVTGATSDPHVIEAMLLGSNLESGWDPTAAGAGSYGDFQLQLDDGGYAGVTVADADSPTFATDRMLSQYTASVAEIPDALWTSNPEEAAEQAAYGAERPSVDYYQGQGTAKVNAAWTATQALLAGAPTSAATAPLSGTGTTTGTTGTLTSFWGDITDPVGTAAKSITAIAVELLAVAAGLGLVVLGAVKTASPSTSVTAAATSAAKKGAMDAALA